MAQVIKLKGKAKKPKKLKKPQKSAAEKAQERLQRAHKSAGRYSLAGLGFKRLNAVIDTAFEYLGTKSDFDDVCVLENVIILCEYTVSKEENISAHIKAKKILYDKIVADTGAFVAFLRTTFPAAAADLTNPLYQDYHYKVRILYCSLNTVKPALKAEVPGIGYFDFSKIQYFKNLVGTIKRSALYEFLAFLGVAFNDFGPRIVKPATKGHTSYSGSLLPEAQSGFPAGFKIVSFYADAETLLNHCYVLRKDGWRDGTMLYQRMVSRAKIEGMRRYLTTEGRVFVNNIIATLPAETILRGESGSNLNSANISKVENVTVELPGEFNSVGLVDGQHRVLSYYTGGANEAKIAPLRHLQNLLVTGLVYPAKFSDEDKIRFEAGLFLEINSNQASAKPELKQAIALLLAPFEHGSIAREVVNRLNDISGAVGGEFERYFYDKDKIKIASIVSFGVKPPVKLGGSDSAFAKWTNPDKEKLVEGQDTALRNAYVQFSASLIDITLGAIKSRVDPALWTRNQKVAGRLLTTTTINGATALLRQLIEGGHPIEFTYLHTKLNGLNTFPFNQYKSSQYNRLGTDLYQKYFG